MNLPTIVTPEYSLVQPSTGKSISYRPFLVKEEKILLMALEAAKSDDEAENREEILKAIKTIITNCCNGLDSVDDLPLFDLEYIFLQLRARSVGEVVEPEIACPKCGETIKLKVDISKVKVVTSKDHTFDIRIDEKVGVIMKYPGVSLFQRRLLGDELAVEDLFEVLIDCMESIYDDEKVYKLKDVDRKQIHEFLDSLSQKQFAKLQNFFETTPRLEHTVNYTCKNKVRTGDTASENCGHKGKVVLNTVNDFFG